MQASIGIHGLQQNRIKPLITEFPQVPVRKFVVTVGEGGPLYGSILDLITTSNPNLVNNIETNNGISDHLLVSFDNCMKTKYQRKLPRKLVNFLKADTNNLKSVVHNFT